LDSPYEWFIFVALALYHLLKGVNRRYASLMVTLVVLGIPIGFLNELNSIAALVLVRGADFLSIFEKPQRDALAMLFLNLHHHGFVVAEIFWGLWLLPLALLVYRSGFLPRFLGVWLAIDGFAYVTLSLTSVLLPQYSDKVSTYSQPAFFGEVAFMLWLLIKGAKPPALDAAASLRQLVRLHFVGCRALLLNRITSEWPVTRAKSPRCQKRQHVGPWRTPVAR
jgi:hypothetical protein